MGERYQWDTQTDRSKQTDNSMAEKEKERQTNKQIIVHRTQHRKLKTIQHELHQNITKTGVISGAPEG